jgi:predicted nucleic acid-binding protein
VILLDTSVLVDAFTGRRRSAPALTAAIDDGERVGVCALVLYEWLRGPRSPRELADLEAVVSAGAAFAFHASEAFLAARLYREVPRARQRELDLGIAACALSRDATLWTLNPADFADIPGLRLYSPAAGQG